MYKKVYLLFVCINGLFTTLIPMELLLQPTYTPLKMFTSLLHEYKPAAYASAATLIGGFFVYDYLYNRSIIKQLNSKVEELEGDVTVLKKQSSTVTLGEVKRVELIVEETKNKLINIVNLDQDLDYLWEFIFTAKSITDHNITECGYNPSDPTKHFLYRPRLPLYRGCTIHNIIKEGVSKALGTSDIYEQLRTNPAQSPRNHVPTSFKPIPIPKRPVTPPEKSEKRKNSASSSPISSRESSDPSSSPSESSDEEEKRLKTKKRKSNNKSKTPPAGQSVPSEEPLKETSLRDKTIPEKKGDD